MRPDARCATQRATVRARRSRALARARPDSLDANRAGLRRGTPGTCTTDPPSDTRSSKRARRDTGPPSTSSSTAARSRRPAVIPSRWPCARSDARQRGRTRAPAHTPTTRAFRDASSARPGSTMFAAASACGTRMAQAGRLRQTRSRPRSLPDPHSLRPGITAQLPVGDRPTPDHGVAFFRDGVNCSTEGAVHVCTPLWRKGARARLVRFRNESSERKEQHECPEGPGDREAADASAWDEAHRAAIGSGEPPLDPCRRSGLHE